MTKLSDQSKSSTQTPICQINPNKPDTASIDNQSDQGDLERGVAAQTTEDSTRQEVGVEKPNAQTTSLNNTEVAQTKLPKHSYVRSPVKTLTNNRTWYRLVSVIEHRGSEVSGHFVTYRKIDHSRGKWIYTSDLDVREVTAEYVHSRPPYMLFYERMSS